MKKFFSTYFRGNSKYYNLFLILIFISFALGLVFVYNNLDLKEFKSKTFLATIISFFIITGLPNIYDSVANDLTVLDEDKTKTEKRKLLGIGSLLNILFLVTIAFCYFTSLNLICSIAAVLISIGFITLVTCGIREIKLKTAYSKK